MSGKAALASVAVFLAIWWGYFYVIDVWVGSTGWLFHGLTLTIILVSFAAAWASGAYVSTRRKD